MKYKATLIHGNVYVYKGKPYEYGKAQIISEKDKLYLEENANIRHKSRGQVFLECQFEFQEVDDDATLVEDSGKSAKSLQTRARKAVPTPAAE